MDTTENVIVEAPMPQKNESANKLTWKDQFGYTLGDLGCVLVFGLAGSLLQKFYTDVLHLPIPQITILFLIARIWDGINDPLWGKIVDMVPPGKHGRYRPWIRTMAIPMGIITLLMFMRYPGMSLGGKLAYAYVTYILWDMVYTTINIPYGSLASVITTDEKARSTLSILRSIGSGIGGVGSLILSGLCFDKVLNDRGEVVPVMNWEKLIIGVAILCGLCIICLFGCFYLTKERVPAPKIKSEKRPKAEFTKVIISLIKSRPFLSLCLASMFLITAQMFGQSYGLYLMADYFLKPEMNIVVTITQYVPMVVIIFFSNKIAAKFGKKESCGIGMLITGLAYLVLFLIKTNNVWVYLAISVIAGIGSSMFILQIWSFVNDVIDYQYVKTNKREETATYSVFSFTRKMGQTIAGVLSTQALGWALYDGESVTGQSEYTQSQLYLWATLIPAIFYLLIGLILLFWYPINKNRMQQLQIDKAKLYAKEGIDIDGIDAIVAEDSVAIKEESLESNQFEENTESEDN